MVSTDHTIADIKYFLKKGGYLKEGDLIYLVGKSHNDIGSSQYLAKYHKVESIEDMEDAAKKIGYPFILKPLSGAKSRYIKKIRSEKDIKPFFEIVKSHSGVISKTFIGTV